MRVLVIGSGHTVKEDLKQLNLSAFDAVIGVNQAAIDFPFVDYHITLHPEKYVDKKAATLISHRPGIGIDAYMNSRWKFGSNSGSSSLFAVKFALEKLEASFVLLAGVPLEGPHYYLPTQWSGSARFQKTWQAVYPLLRGKVYSLSGWTAKLLNGLDQPKSPVFRYFVKEMEGLNNVR